MAAFVATAVTGVDSVRDRVDCDREPIGPGDGGGDWLAAAGDDGLVAGRAVYDRDGVVARGNVDGVGGLIDGVAPGAAPVRARGAA